jgi:hypothetical protein
VFWCWHRFLVALASLVDPPATPEELTVDHLERYWRQRHAEVKQRGLVHEVRAVGRVVGEMPAGMIADDGDRIQAGADPWRCGSRPHMGEFRRFGGAIGGSRPIASNDLCCAFSVN